MAKLGDRVQDYITGFEGIVIGRAEYVNGCVRVEVQPEGLSEKGEMLEPQWIDEQRVDAASNADAGGPQNDPPRR